MQNDKVWTKNFLLIIIINFLVFMNHIMILSTFTMFLEQVLGLNAAMAGLAAFLLLALVPGAVSFYIAAVLAGYAFGGIEPALQSMAVHIALPERRGSANSTFRCAYDIGLGGGGGIAGALISALGFSSMFLILSLATVVSVLLYVLWGRKHRSSFTYAKRRDS